MNSLFFVPILFPFAWALEFEPRKEIAIQGFFFHKVKIMKFTQLFKEI